jgi:hypothetical protein
LGIKMINDDTVVTVGMLKQFLQNSVNESRAAMAASCERVLKAKALPLTAALPTLGRPEVN